MATRHFHWDVVDDCVLHETDGGGATTVEYTHEPSQYGPLLSETRSGVESYHHYDALGSTTVLSDTAGNVTDTFQYDAWGNELARTGTTPTPYSWVGRWGYQHDTPTGGYYIRARSYLPTVARWMSEDPIAGILPPHLEDLYGYSYNGPATKFDPTGNVPCPASGECKGFFPGAGAGPTISDHRCDLIDWLRGACCTACQLSIATACCKKKKKKIGTCGQVLTTVMQCIVQADFIWTCDDDPCYGLKILQFSRALMPNVTANITAGQATHGSGPFVHDPANATARRNIACPSGTCTPPQQCDEYPFASSTAGGAGATTACVPAVENQRQGQVIGTAGLKVSDKYCVEVVP